MSGIIWAMQWHNCNQLDGDRKYILWDDGLPKLFRTRREARAYIKEKYGYIAERPDLQSEPHGWRMPQAIKVTVQPQHLPMETGNKMEGGD